MNNTKSKTDQKRQLKKYAVFGAMFLLFGLAIWLIFAPSKKDMEKKEKESGFNVNVPSPKDEMIIDDKKAAYEQEQVRLRQVEKMKSLQDYSFLIGDETNQMPDDENSPVPENVQSVAGKTSKTPTYTVPSKRRNTFEESGNAYNDINRTLGSFYEKPKEDPEKKALEEKIERLEALINEREKPVTMEDRLALMEKSYEMATKYAPQNGQLLPGNKEENIAVDNTGFTKTQRNKPVVSHVSQVSEQVVSGLVQPMSDAEFIKQMSLPRNLGFHSIDDGAGETVKNTISACVHDDQVLVDGLGNDEARKTVRLRLTEPMQIDNLIIPEHTIITGNAAFQGERLGIHVSSIEFDGMIIQVNLNAYDLDGQSGIYVPGSMEINALKEVAANMGTNMGSSVNISQQSAKDQLISDLGRGAIQGTSQYVSKKIRVKKAMLKSGHKIFLLPSNNQ